MECGVGGCRHPLAAFDPIGTPGILDSTFLRGKVWCIPAKRVGGYGPGRRRRPARRVGGYGQSLEPAPAEVTMAEAAPAETMPAPALAPAAPAPAPAPAPARKALAAFADTL